MPHLSDPHIAERVLASFDKQNAMHLVKATMPVVQSGMTEIHVPHWDGIEQQHDRTLHSGFCPPGANAAICPSARRIQSSRQDNGRGRAVAV